MGTTNYEEIKRMNELESEIKQTDETLKSNRFKDTKEELKRNIRKIFPEYKDLAEKYGVSKSEIKPIKEIYDKYQN